MDFTVLLGHTLNSFFFFTNERVIDRKFGEGSGLLWAFNACPTVQLTPTHPSRTYTKSHLVFASDTSCFHLATYVSYALNHAADSFTAAF